MESHLLWAVTMIDPTPVAGDTDHELFADCFCSKIIKSIELVVVCRRTDPSLKLTQAYQYLVPVYRYDTWYRRLHTSAWTQGQFGGQPHFPPLAFA
jgi:hypothetical protein